MLKKPRRLHSAFLLFLMHFLMLFILSSCSEEEDDDTVENDCNNSDLSIDIVSSSPSTCGSASGTVEVTATGGAGEYQFRLDDGSYSSSANFDGISSGDHQLFVQDAEGCISDIDLEIASEGEVSYSESVAAIIETNCAVSGCHVAGTSRQDFTGFQRIQELSSEIKRRTGNGSMPPSGGLTQTQIDLIACWVDQGALNN